MRFYVHKLGCPKNDVDGDYIAARLIAAGHKPVATEDNAEAIIVNTCGFIQPAKEESIDEILRLGQLKVSGGLRRLYAAGCLSQRYGDELLADIPELDGAFGLGALDSLADAVTARARLERSVRIDSRRLGYLSWKQRYVGNGLPYAYLKISDGCDRACTYCAIPGIRGKYRSRPLDAIVREAQFLVEKGRKELILVSQEATLYGYDLPGRPSILDLLRRLEQETDVAWLRLMYLYPPKLERSVIEYLAADNKTLSYFDLPLQHVNNDILATMHRRMDNGGVRGLVRTIREISPGAVLRTTFIVGFPGETDQQFEELCDALTEFRFDRMGAFTYSQEEGTPAQVLERQVDETVKTERMDRLMQLQQEVAFARNESLKGSIVDVIIDSVTDKGTAVGRTRGDCPEIDQEVHVTGTPAAVGDILAVRIDGTDGYDLHGTIVEAAT